MIKNTIYIRELSMDEKNILEKISEEQGTSSGLETIRFILEDYNTKKIALNYQKKRLESLKAEIEELKKERDIIKNKSQELHEQLTIFLQKF